MNRNERFYYEHAGYAYDPGIEAREAGRVRCCTELARAADWGDDQGLYFLWSEDPESWADRSGIEHDRPLWQCECKRAGEVVAYLGMIDLGTHGMALPYCRVVQAELALEVMTDSAILPSE